MAKDRWSNLFYDFVHEHGQKLFYLVLGLGFIYLMLHMNWVAEAKQDVAILFGIVLSQIKKLYNFRKNTDENKR